MFFGRSDHCHQWFYDGFLMLLPSLSMVFDGSGPLVKRCDGFNGSLWSTIRDGDRTVLTVCTLFSLFRLVTLLTQLTLFALFSIPRAINDLGSHIKKYSNQTIFCFWRAQFCFDPNSMSLCGWKIYGDNCDLFLSSRDFKCKERNWEFTKVHEGGGAIYISDFSTGSKQFREKNLLKMYSCRF